MEIFNIRMLTRAEQQWTEFMFEEWIHYRMKPFYLSMKNIDKKIGVTKRTQLRTIRKLKQQGIIEVDKKPTRNRTILQNYYSFLKAPQNKSHLLPKEILETEPKNPMISIYAKNAPINAKNPMISIYAKNAPLSVLYSSSNIDKTRSRSRFNFVFSSKRPLLTKRAIPVNSSASIHNHSNTSKTPANSSIRDYTSKTPANSSIREKMRELKKVSRTDRNKPIVDNIINRWNSKGSPLSSHKIGNTKIYSKITSAISKELIRNSRLDIYRAIDNYHWLLTETSVKYKLRFARNGKGYTGLIVKLDEFFKFDRFTADAPSFKYTFHSWFKECLLDRDQLVKRHCEGDPALAKKIQREWCSRIGKEAYFKDFMNASHLLTTFYKTHRIRNLIHNHKVTHLITALIENGLDHRAKDSSVLTQKFVYDSVLLYYFKSTGQYVPHKKPKKKPITTEPKRELKLVVRGKAEPVRTPLSDWIRRKNEEKKKAVQESHSQ